MCYSDYMSNDPGWISLTEAARRIGYRGSQALRKAALDGRLKTIMPSPRIRLTTHVWLDEYLATLQHPNTEKRGQPRQKEENTEET